MKIYSPLQGKLVALETVPDAVFSGKMMGEGVAIIPSSNKVLSPVKGKLTSVFPTKHAFGIETEDGVEVLIHVGIDTVDLKGKHFDLKVEQGEKVEIGDLLVEVDFDAINKAGYPIITPIIILNTGSFENVVNESDKELEYLDTIIELQ